MIVKMFDNRGLQLLYDKERKRYIIRTPTGMTSEYDRPKTAWAIYIYKLDEMVNRQIDESLANNDK